jgi:glycosyltransferase involved in cell wall biosynthesis
MPPAVSIILPTYNRLTYLQEAVQSVLDQTAGDWELIVVDDGSTDESVAWLESLGEPRVSVVREQHTGNRSALRNLGVERARAEWIAFLDSDDRWHPEKLQRQLALQRANPRYRWSYTGYGFIDATGSPLMLQPANKPWPAHSGWILEQEVALKANIALPSVMLDRALFREAGGFDETFSWAEDHELWFRLAERAECGVVDEPLLDVRIHRDPSIPEPDLCLGFVRIYRNFAERTNDPALRETARRMQAYKAVDAVGMLTTLRRWSEARAALMIAFRVHPLGPFVYKASLRLLWGRLRAVFVRREAFPAAPRHTDGIPPQVIRRDR